MSRKKDRPKGHTEDKAHGTATGPEAESQTEGLSVDGVLDETSEVSDEAPEAPNFRVVNGGKDDGPTPIEAALDEEQKTQRILDLLLEQADTQVKTLSDLHKPEEKEPINLAKGLHEQVICAMRALEIRPDVYQRDGVLVEVAQTRESVGTVSVMKSAIKTMAETRVHELLEWSCVGLKFDQKAGGWAKSTKLPKDIAKALVNRGIYPRIPRIVAVANHPIFRCSRDTGQAEAFAEYGLDEETGVYIPEESFPALPAVPKVPTAEQIEIAKAWLKAPVEECDAIDKDLLESLLASAIMTALAKFSYMGPSGPLHVISATGPGVGKGLISDVIGIVVQGRPPDKRLMQTKDKDLNALLLSLALPGEQIVCFDNITPLTGSGGAALNIALTSDTMSERQYMTNKSWSLSFRPLWLANGNSYTPPADGGRRMIIAHLTSKEAEAHKRKFKREKLDDFVRESRAQILWSALTILSGYEAAGRPKQAFSALGAFNGWSDNVRAPLVWAGFKDPVESQATIADAGMVIVENIIRGLILLDPNNEGRTSVEIHESAQMTQEGFKKTSRNDFLRAVVGDRKKEQWAKFLAEFNGRIVHVDGQDLRLVRRRDKNKGYLWVRQNAAEKIRLSDED